MPEISESRYLVRAGWDDVPHLTEKTKRELLNSTPPYLRDARSKGEASLGQGAIYAIPVEQVTFTPFVMPAYWPRVYGLDVGWNRTAAIWLAWDRETDTAYAYTEHYVGKELPLIHAASIKARGSWIPGVIDPAARGRSQRDGKQLYADYMTAGLRLELAENAVESGIYAVWDRLATGRLKISTACTNLLAEYKLYHRDEHGHVVKKHDHALDALRYAVVSGLPIAKVRPVQHVIPSIPSAADSTAGY